MTTQAIYCRKCRDANGHLIARGKIGPEIFRRVNIKNRNKNGSYQCVCECGHTWPSKSKEAEKIYQQTVRQQP